MGQVQGQPWAGVCYRRLPSGNPFDGQICYLLLCKFPGAEANSLGLDQRRNERLCVAPTGAGRTNRVHGMNAGRSLRHSKFVGFREDKEAREVVREWNGTDWVGISLTATRK